MRCSSFALLLSLMLICQPEVEARDARAFVITTAGVAPYQTAAAAAKRTLEEKVGSVSLISLERDQSTLGATLAGIDADDVVVAVGSGVIQSLLGRTNAYLVGCMTLTAPSALGGKSGAALLMDFPPEVRIEWVRRLMPEARSLGLIYLASEAAGRDEAVATAARKAGLNLQLYPISSPAELSMVFEKAAAENDVMMTLADSLMMAPLSAKQLLLVSFRSRVPVIGLSDPWAKAGALYALDWDFEDIGRQCGQMALKALSPPRTAQPVSWPRKARLAVNLRTARHMKIEFSESQLQQAAQVYQ